MNAIRLNAGNDGNGNPRRVYVIFSSDGVITDTVDEGYLGREALTQAHPEFKSVFVPSFETTPRQYRRLVKLFDPSRR
jgi:hypothetical protein